MHDIPKAKALYHDSLANPVTSPETLHLELSNPDALIRHVAAIQLASLHPSQVPHNVIAELVDTLRAVSIISARRDPFVESYLQATLSDDDWHDLGQDIALALANLPACPDSPFIPTVVQVWKEGAQFYEAGLAAIALAFPITHLPVPATSLNPAQLSVLRALAADDAMWKYCGDTEPMLIARALPTSQAAMQTYLQKSRT